jgi:hypothetical protein
LEWFERFNDDAEIMRTLVQDDESDTWDFGAKESPNRHFLLGCAQLDLQNLQAAHGHFRSALPKLQKPQLGFQSQLEIMLSKLLDDLKLPT